MLGTCAKGKLYTISNLYILHRLGDEVWKFKNWIRLYTIIIWIGKMSKLDYWFNELTKWLSHFPAKQVSCHNKKPSSVMKVKKSILSTKIISGALEKYVWRLAKQEYRKLFYVVCSVVLYDVIFIVFISKYLPSDSRYL